MKKRFGLEAVAVVAAGLLAVGCMAEGPSASEEVRTGEQALAARITGLRHVRVTLDRLPTGTTAEIPVDECAIATDSPFAPWIEASVEGTVDPLHLSLASYAPEGTSSRELEKAVLTKVDFPNSDEGPFAIVTAADPDAGPIVFTAAPSSAPTEKPSGNFEHTDIVRNGAHDTMKLEPMGIGAIGIGPFDNVCAKKKPKPKGGSSTKDYLLTIDGVMGESSAMTTTTLGAMTVETARGGINVAMGDINAAFEGDEADRMQRMPPTGATIKLRKTLPDGHSMRYELANVLVSSLVDVPATRETPHKVVVRLRGKVVVRFDAHGTAFESKRQVSIVQDL